MQHTEEIYLHLVFALQYLLWIEERLYSNSLDGNYFILYGSSYFNNKLTLVL